MSTTVFDVTIVDDDTRLSLAELCRACRAPEEQVRIWVVEGVLEPVGPSPQEWRFGAASLRRARLALMLTRELEINAPGVALALDLMDQIAALKAAAQRAGGR